MKNRFVVAVGELSESEAEKFKRHLQSKSIECWQVVDDLWLVVDSTDFYDASSLRDYFADLAAPTHNIVVQIKDLSDVEIAALIPTDPDNHMVNWLRNHWYDN